jgi:4-amino-4-deoxy-L-arabinose transferase-like glycosyltransferase
MRISLRDRLLTVVVSLVLMLGLALRTYRLDHQSLWSDEGISLQRSAQSLPQMLAGMPVEQLPGYFVLLHLWIALAGEDDFALRFFSVWPSVLAIAVIFRLGADLGGRRATRWPGLIAALLLAANPFQIWYAQEARGYSWLFACGLASTWCFWRLLHAPPPLQSPPSLGGTQGGSPRARPRGDATPQVPARAGRFAVVGYVAATTLAIYLHFYGFLVPLAHAIFLAGWLVYHRDWRLALPWLGASALVALCFLPWLPRALRILGFTGWREPLDPWMIPWRFWVAYAAGDAMPEPWRIWLPWVYLALSVLGLFAWWRRSASSGKNPLGAAQFLLCNALAPVLVVFLLALRQPDTHERYAIFVMGPMLLCVAGGLAVPFAWTPVERRWPMLFARASGLLVIGGFVLAGGLAINRVHSDQTLQKPDYRAAAQAIMRNLQPGDVVFVDGPDPRLVFLHYYEGAAPVHDLRFLLDADADKISRTLTELTVNAGRAWEVLYFHEPGPVQHWLAIHGWTAPPTAYNGIRLTLYGLAPVAAPPPLQFPPSMGGTQGGSQANIGFGPAMTLTVASVTPASVSAGDPVWVTTRWQVHQPPPDYKFSLRLMDAAGNVIKAEDYVPQNWFTPTTVWPVGESIEDRRGMVAPEDLPAGRYRVQLRLYDPANGLAVETVAGQDVLLGEIEVTR